MAERLSIQQEKRSNAEESSARLFDDLENIPALHGKKLQEMFSSENNIRSFIEELDEDDFVSFLNSINGIIRNKDKKEWQIDGAGIALRLGEGLPEYTPPHIEDRRKLFGEVLQAAKEMLKDGRSIEDIAILFSSSVNAIHAYADANGRTSRALFLLLTHGMNEKAKVMIKEALSENGRELLDVNPEKIEPELIEILIKDINFNRPIGLWESENNRKDIAINQSVSDDLKTELLELLSDKTFSSIALQQFLKEETGLDDCLKHYPEREGWGGKKLREMYNVKVDDLFRVIDEVQARKILSLYRKIKAKMIRLLIDAIAHPDRDDYTTSYGASVFEKFKDKIELGTLK